MSWPGRTPMQAQSAATGQAGALSPHLRAWRRPVPGRATVAAPAPPASHAADVEPVEAAFEWTGPFVLFCVYTFILVGRPQDHFPALSPIRPALTMTGISALVALLRPEKGGLRALWQLPEAKYYFGLFAAMLWTIPFAMYRPSAFDFVVMQYIVNVIYFVLFATTVNTLERFRRITVVLVFSSLLFAFMGLSRGEFIQGRYSVGSEMYDPNDVAFVVIALLGFEMWALAGRFSVTLKIAAAASAIMGALLTLYTASRGGLLGLSAFLVLFMTLRVRRFGRGFRLLLVLGIFAAGYFNADKINVERFMTLTDLKDDYNFEEWGRADIWERGLKLFMRDPLTGVGVTNFGVAIGMMRWDENLIPKFQAPHSAYLEILTETGIFGSAAFLLLVGTTLWTFNRVRRLPATSQGQLELASLGGVLLVGFVAQLVVAAFLTQAYSMFFTLSFSASAALRRLADERTTQDAGLPQPPAPGSSGSPTFKLRPRTKTT